MSKNYNGPKILFFDIETAPIIAHVWDIWNVNVGLNQIVSDWHVLSWSAKWKHETKIMYQDQRGVSDIKNDKKLLQGIWKLLDEADIVITQNGVKFDQKKLFARFIMNGMKPPSGFKHIDTYKIAKKHFGFTSNKLLHLSAILCPEEKKDEHKNFPGHYLWVECLKGNIKAWREMEKYNKQDVITLENVYNRLIPWSDNSPNFNVYHNDETHVCKCGSISFKRNGFHYTQTAKYQRYKCTECHSECRDRTNLFDKEKTKSLKVNTPR